MVGQQGSKIEGKRRGREGVEAQQGNRMGIGLGRHLDRRGLVGEVVSTVLDMECVYIWTVTLK